MTDTKSAVRRAPAPGQKTKPKATLILKSDSIKTETGKITRTRTGSDASFAAQKVILDNGATFISYVRSKGVDIFVTSVHDANPIQLIEMERRGVTSVFVKDLSKRMEIPAQRMFDILGVPKATAERKVAAGELLAGNGGRAVLGITKLLGIANEIVEDSTAPAAKDFDTAKWLGRWLEKPQPALGGRKPAELIDTPTGLEVVSRLLGAIQSGAYQ